MSGLIHKILNRQNESDKLMLSGLKQILENEDMGDIRDADVLVKRLRQKELEDLKEEFEILEDRAEGGYKEFLDEYYYEYEDRNPERFFYFHLSEFILKIYQRGFELKDIHLDFEYKLLIINYKFYLGALKNYRDFYSVKSLETCLKRCMENAERSANDSRTYTACIDSGTSEIDYYHQHLEWVAEHLKKFDDQRKSIQDRDKIAELEKFDEEYKKYQEYYEKCKKQFEEYFRIDFESYFKQQKIREEEIRKSIEKKY